MGETLLCIDYLHYHGPAQAQARAQASTKVRAQASTKVRARASTKVRARASKKARARVRAQVGLGLRWGRGEVKMEVNWYLIFGLVMLSVSTETRSE